MDYRHNKGIHSNSNSDSSNISPLLYRDKIIRKFQSILKPFLKVVVVPFTALSSTFLFANFAHAEGFKDIIFRQKGVLTTDYSGMDKTTLFGIGELVKNVNSAIDWLKDIKHHIYDFSIDVFAFIFEMLMLVGLQTPSFIFNNNYTINTTMIFSVVSISIVILLTIYESFVQMFSKVSKSRYTKFSDILKRFPIAIGIAGFVPFLFQEGFKVINKITRGITALGGDLLKSNNINEVISLSGIDVLGMILFDITALGLLIPILLQGGRRWWDLFCLSTISPLAFTAWIFDRHRHMYTSWWSNIKKLSIIQLVYATFIVLMGVFLYSARYISSEYWVYKILIVLGAMYRIANPPSFVKAYSRNEEDVVGLFDTYKRAFTGVYDTVTLKGFKPLNYYRSQKALNTQRKALRVQHGKRFVDNLLGGKKR